MEVRGRGGVPLADERVIASPLFCPLPFASPPAAFFSLFTRSLFTSLRPSCSLCVQSSSSSISSERIGERLVGWRTPRPCLTCECIGLGAHLIFNRENAAVQEVVPRRVGQHGGAVCAILVSETSVALIASNSHPCLLVRVRELWKITRE